MDYISCRTYHPIYNISFHDIHPHDSTSHLIFSLSFTTLPLVCPTSSASTFVSYQVPAGSYTIAHSTLFTLSLASSLSISRVPSLLLFALLCFVFAFFKYVCMCCAVAWHELSGLGFVILCSENVGHPRWTGCRHVWFPRQDVISLVSRADSALAGVINSSVDVSCQRFEKCLI